MGIIKKIDKNHRQSLVLHGFCLTLFLTFVFINHNVTVIAQTFAHYTYVPIELESSEAPLECHYNKNYYCWSEPWWWMHERNVAEQECKLIMPEHKYRIDNQEFTLRTNTYTYEPLCKLEKTIYVSPLYPGWAVADNRLPGELTLNTLLKTTILLLVWIALYTYLSCLLLKCRPAQIPKALIAETRKMSVLNSLLLSYYAAATAQMIQYMYVYALNPEEMGDHRFLAGGIPILVGIVIYIIYTPLRYILLTPLVYFLFSFVLPFIFYFALEPTIAVLPISPSDPIISGFAYLILHLIIILAITTYSRLKAAQRT